MVADFDIFFILMFFSSSQDAADIDNLVIAPSQDYFDDPFDAAEEGNDKDDKTGDGGGCADDEESANQNTQQQQPCGFVDFRDRTSSFCCCPICLVHAVAAWMRGCILPLTLSCMGLLYDANAAVTQFTDECSEVFDGECQWQRQPRRRCCDTKKQHRLYRVTD